MLKEAESRDSLQQPNRKKLRLLVAFLLSLGTAVPATLITDALAIDFKTAKNVYCEGSEWCAAARTGDLKQIKKMLKKGQDINADIGSNETALHGAINNGCIEVVRYLLEQGADIHIKDDYGQTAMDEAKGRFGWREKEGPIFIELLKEYGAKEKKTASKKKEKAGQSSRRAGSSISSYEKRCRARHRDISHRFFNDCPLPNWVEARLGSITDKQIRCMLERGQTDEARSWCGF